jgi:uncharacterized coiled-coil protein SlyX
MRKTVWTIQASCVLCLGLLSGCANLFPPSPLAPVLLVDPAEGKLIEALAHEQYTRIESCQARKSCPQDQYTRGLIALFQSRERALESFQQVRALAPDSRVAFMSTSWIELLQPSGRSLSVLNVQQAGVPKVTEDFVWEALEREFEGANETVRGLFSERAKRVGGLMDRRPVISQEQATSPKDPDQAATIQALQKRLQERERTIAQRDQQMKVIASQLEDLKRIEKDTHDRRKAVRSSTIVAP